MEAKQLLSGVYSATFSMMQPVLQGLSQDDLNWQPRPDCNSIGWLAWHAAREQDATISYQMKDDQLWIKDKWHEKFGRPADKKDFGTGQTQEQVAGFRSPDAETVLQYYKAVADRSQKYISSLTGTDIDQEANIKFLQPPPSLGSWLMRMGLECIQHAGQAGYVRGLKNGIGWQNH